MKVKVQSLKLMSCPSLTIHRVIYYLFIREKYTAIRFRR